MEILCWFLGEISSSNFPEILELADHIRNVSLDIFYALTSKNISIIDCQIVALCRAYSIKTIFSFDKHFRKLGLKLL